MVFAGLLQRCSNPPLPHHHAGVTPRNGKYDDDDDLTETYYNAGYEAGALRMQHAKLFSFLQVRLRRLPLYRSISLSKLDLERSIPLLGHVI
jgi:hypothetical protein